MAKLPQHARYMFRHAAKAVEILATYDGGIIQRLTFAGEELLNIHPDALPDELKEQFKAIVDYLTEHKADPNSRLPFNTDLHITMKRRRPKTATKIATQIFSFYVQYNSITG